MPSSAELLCINPAIVGRIWPLARGLIKSAMDRTRLSDFGRVESEVLAGLQLLWLAKGDDIEAAAVTQLTTIGDRKFCIVVACGGRNRARWLPLLEKIEAYAREEGCKAMRIGGRRGWERVLDRYRLKYVTLERDL
jgi:hypothetical protein